MYIWYTGYTFIYSYACEEAGSRSSRRTASRRTPPSGHPSSTVRTWNGMCQIPLTSLIRAPAPP